MSTPSHDEINANRRRLYHEFVSIGVDSWMTCEAGKSSIGVSRF